MTDPTDEEIAREIGDRLLERGMHIFPRSQFEEIVLAALRSARLAARLAERERCAEIASDRATALREAQATANAAASYDDAARCGAAAWNCEHVAAAIRETDSDV